VDRKVLGLFYGHTFRKFLAASPGQVSACTFIFTESPLHLPSENIHCLVVSGGPPPLGDSSPSAYLDRGERIIMVNPSFTPDDAKLNNALVARMVVYFGEYMQLPSRSSWSSYPGLKVLQIDGAANFVPNWPTVILQSQKVAGTL
jgi:hypothetical protein